jgi:hypothetical protein
MSKVEVLLWNFSGESGKNSECALQGSVSSPDSNQALPKYKLILLMPASFHILASHY